MVTSWRVIEVIWYPEQADPVSSVLPCGVPKSLPELPEFLRCWSRRHGKLLITAKIYMSFLLVVLRIVLPVSSLGRMAGRIQVTFLWIPNDFWVSSPLETAFDSRLKHFLCRSPTNILTHCLMICCQEIIVADTLHLLFRMQKRTIVPCPLAVSFEIHF